MPGSRARGLGTVIRCPMEMMRHESDMRARALFLVFLPETRLILGLVVFAGCRGVVVLVRLGLRWRGIRLFGVAALGGRAVLRRGLMSRPVGLWTRFADANIRARGLRGTFWWWCWGSAALEGLRWRGTERDPVGCISSEGRGRRNDGLGALGEACGRQLLVMGGRIEEWPKF